MSKTFDNIAEAASTNYLFLKAQMTISLEHEPPTPPPLHVLSFPFELLCAALWLVKRLAPEGSGLHKWASGPSWFERWATRTDPGKDTVTTALETPWFVKRLAPAASGLQKWASGPSWFRTDPGRNTANTALSESSTPASPSWRRSSKSLNNTTDGHTIQTLAKAITEYVLDHQADVAQEERWRTSMQRKMDQNNRSFRELVMTANKESQRNQDQMKANQKQNLANQEHMKANQKQNLENQDQMKANQKQNLANQELMKENQNKIEHDLKELHALTLACLTRVLAN